jgi:ABC-type xylose transport system permease subunit
MTPVIGLLIGAASGTFAVKLRVNAFLVTLATLLLMRGAVVYLIPEGVYYLPQTYTYLGEERWFGVPIAIYVWLLLYCVAYIMMEHHRIGKEIYAIGNNEEAASGRREGPAHEDTVLCDRRLFGGRRWHAGGRTPSVDRRRSRRRIHSHGLCRHDPRRYQPERRRRTAFRRIRGSCRDRAYRVIENIMNLIGIEPSIRQMVFGCVLLIAIYLASLQDRFAMRTENN